MELPSPLVDSWDLKSSMRSKQILGILESPYLLSKLTTHQLSKQISFRHSFLSFHEIENIHQIRDNNHIKSFNPKKINKIWYIAYHRNNMSSGFSITWFGFSKILDNVLYNFYLTIIYFDVIFTNCIKNIHIFLIDKVWQQIWLYFKDTISLNIFN